MLSVNVGRPREVEWRGRRIRTAIWKSPVTGRSVTLRGVNLDGDEQADRAVHGGNDKAVYAYAVEDYQYWADEEDVAVEPGLFGENLTVQGVDLAAAVIGEQWVVGSATLEVAQPRLPCFKLGLRMHDEHFPARFMAAGRLGAYFRIIEAGEIGAGDEIQSRSTPGHGITLSMLVRSLADPEAAARILAAPQLPRFWRDRAARVASGTW